MLVKVLTPGFFAREDTRTPVKIAIVCLRRNVVLSLSLIWPLAHVGIALATAISAWLNAGLLARCLHRDGLLQPDARLQAPRCRGSRWPALAMAAGLLCSQPLARAAAAGAGARAADRGGGGGFFAARGAARGRAATRRAAGDAAPAPRLTPARRVPR